MSELTEQERAEIERDAALPQLDARGLVDEAYLERAIKEMYTEVAENPAGELHFLTGRPLAEDLGDEPALLDRIPADAVESFAVVGHYLDLAGLRETIEATGMQVQEVRENQYEFPTERALEASAEYGVVSVTLMAAGE
jgi:hypothetical protein